MSGFTDSFSNLNIQYRRLMDRITPFLLYRWVVFTVLYFLFTYRVYSKQGWYIIMYGLGIYHLNIFIGFLSPQMDVETDGPILPTANEEEFRPFARKVSEFKAWELSFRALLLALTMSLIPLFNIPVFWPILVIYFVVLFSYTMKNQIKHMIKYRYIPFSWGKKVYKGKKVKRANDSAKPGEATGVRRPQPATANAESMFRGGGGTTTV